MQYRLKRDVPGVKAGTISDNGSCEFYTFYGKEHNYEIEIKDMLKLPDWFETVGDEEITKFILENFKEHNKSTSYFLADKINQIIDHIKKENK